MKRFLAAALATIMLIGLGTPAAYALSDADNGSLAFFASADAYSGFMEFDSLKTVYGFDVQGYMDIEGEQVLVSSTFDDHGYHTFINVDGANGPMKGVLYLSEEEIDALAEEAVAPIHSMYLAGAIGYNEYLDALNDKKAEYAAVCDAQAGNYDVEAALAAMSYNCAGSEVQSIGGLNLKLENSFAGDGKFVKISYTVSNPTEEEKSFSLATTADVKVGGDDSATLKLMNGGQGAKLISDKDNSMFTVDGSECGLDGIWIGEWSYDYFRHMFDKSHEDTVFSDKDSAICWCWTDRKIAPRETVSFYVYMEVGMNSSPSVTIEDDLENVGLELNGYVSDPNLGSVDLHYIIDDGEEKVIEGIVITGENQSFAIPTSDFDCGSAHTVKLWAVDDAGEVSDISVLTVGTAHTWVDPIVVLAPTATENGVVSYSCEDCGEPSMSVMCFGDSTLDGVVNSLDASLILKYDAGIQAVLTPIQHVHSDVNGDGALNSLDAAQILKYDALLINSFESATFDEAHFAELCVEYYGYYTGNTEGDGDESGGEESDFEDVGSEDGDNSEDGEISLEIDVALLGSWSCEGNDGFVETFVFKEGNVGTYTKTDGATETESDIYWGITEGRLYIEIAAEAGFTINYTVMGGFLVLSDADGNRLFVENENTHTPDEDSSIEESSSNIAVPELSTLKAVSDHLNKEKDENRLIIDFVYTGDSAISAQHIARMTCALYVSYRWRGDAYTVELYEYPGERMADAFFSKNIDGLSAEEREALAKAIVIVGAGQKRTADDYELEKFLHDYIINTVSYYNGSISVSNPKEPQSQLTAVGALLEGEANCQGYSDLFYLLASVAGFEVNKMCAVSYTNGGGHMFNTVKLNGQYFILDTTYDDVFTDVIDYRLFNAGKDMCHEYYWDETMEYRQIAAKSDHHYFYKHVEDRLFYTVEEMAEAISDGLISGQKLFHTALIGTACNWEPLDDALYEALSNKNVPFAYNIWSNNNSINTFFVVKFH